MKPTKKPEPRKGSASSPTKKKKESFKSLFPWIAAIAAIAFIAFSPCLKNDLLSWDDYNYIRDNPLIRLFTIQNIVHLFNYHTYVVGNYHPLTMLTYIIEYQLAGVNPVLYHFDNLLLHLFNIVLFSYMMWLMTKKKIAILVATMLFAVHPMRVESVVWAAERKDVLYTFFFLLALISYIWFLLRDRKQVSFYILSIGFFILSILSKGQAVVLPLVLILADYWFDKKITVKSLADKIPFFLVSLLSGIQAIAAQHSSLTEQRMGAHSFPERITVALFNISAYLFKLIWPFSLRAFYSYPPPDEMSLIYGGAVLAVVIVVLVLFFYRKNKTVVFGSLFFLFTISIVSQILPVGNAIIADRYAYIPYIGLFFIAGIFIDRLSERDQRNKAYYLAIPVFLGLVFTIKSYAQAQTWKDNVTLWENALGQDPGNWLAHLNLGKQYTDDQDYQKAIGHLNEAVASKAAYADIFLANVNLGVAISKTGDYNDAIRRFTIAIASRPNATEALFSRGICYSSAGKYDSAVADFTLIVRKYEPGHIRAWYSRAMAYNKMGQADSALADYTKAIGIDPGFADAWVNRGNIYQGRQMFDSALADYGHALQITPDDGTIWLNRSFTWFKIKKFGEALNDALKASERKANVNPNYLRDLKRLNGTP